MSSYIFYGYWKPAFCILMAVSTLGSYLAGVGLLRWGGNPRARRTLLIAPIVLDLGLLAYFKYADFAIGILNWPLTWYGQMPLAPLNVILPVGISFYTFGSISYVVDCFRGSVRPTKNLLEFACFISFFPQLVAGPIIRFAELQEDLEEIEQSDRRKDLDRAWSFFIIGISQKVLLADTIALIINPALKDIPSLSTGTAWRCMIGYAYQLYFDFAGYSNMAIGLGLMFGIRIPQNFRSPYKALNPSDFWTRWHISLSRSLRDYLYIPLGGNRRGALITYRNLMTTMLTAAYGMALRGHSWPGAPITACC